jgi:hypothetical protein
MGSAGSTGMKNQLSKLALVGTTALLLNVGWVMADETSAPTSSPANPSGVSNATSGTAAGMTSKNGQNNPPGMDKQRTASMSENSKKTHLRPKGTIAQHKDQHSPSATKTPQQVSVPATTQP